MKKNSQKKDILIPRVGEYYQTFRGGILKIIQVNEGKGEAIYHFIDSKRIHIWDYELYPEVLNYKLTPLELELL